MTASFTSSPFIEQTPIAVPLERSMGAAHSPHTCPRPVLWNRVFGQRRDTADISRARELGQTENGDDMVITLVRCRNTRRGGRALTGKGIDVLVIADGGMIGVETVRQSLQEGHDLVLLRIR